MLVSACSRDSLRTPKGWRGVSVDILVNSADCWMKGSSGRVAKAKTGICSLVYLALSGDDGDGDGMKQAECQHSSKQINFTTINLLQFSSSTIQLDFFQKRTQR